MHSSTVANIFASQLDLDALVAAIRSLEALAHERTVAKLKQESGDVGYDANDDDHFTLPYDPVPIFLLEAMVSITCQTAQYIEDVWCVTTIARAFDDSRFMQAHCV